MVATLFVDHIIITTDVIGGNIALRRFLYNKNIHGNIATEESPKPGLSLNDKNLFCEIY